MAPLGEWSLEATILDGARGRPTPSHHLTSRWDKIFQALADGPFAAHPPIWAVNGPDVYADSAYNRRSRTG